MWLKSNEQHLSGQVLLLASHCSYLLLGRTGGQAHSLEIPWWAVCSETIWTLWCSCLWHRAVWYSRTATVCKNLEERNTMVGCLFRNNMDVVVFLVVTPCSLIYPYCYCSLRIWKNVIPANASKLARSFSVDRSATRRSCQSRRRSLPVRLQDVIVTLKVRDGSSQDDRRVSVDSFFLTNRRKSLVTRLATAVPSTVEDPRFAHQLLPPSSRLVRFRLKVNRSRPNRENEIANVNAPQDFLTYTCIW
jgi:hypothetical protein